MKANKIIWVGLAILLGVGMGNAGAATNEVSALLQQGLFEEEANQNLDAAIQAYQAVVAQTDKDRQFAATAIFRLGECYRKLGRTNEAAAQYQRILRDFPDRTDLAKLSQQDLAGIGMPVPGPGVAVSASQENPDAQLWNKVKDLPPSTLERILPTLAPDPVLTSLLQQRNEAETKLAQFRNNEGELNPDVTGAKAVLDTINKQISEKISGIYQALKLRAEISGASGPTTAPVISDAALQAQKQLLEEEIKVFEQQLESQQARAKQGVVSPDEPLSTMQKLLELKRQLSLLDAGQLVSPQPTAEPSEEDKQLARLQAMVKDNPDLINGQSGNNIPLIDAATMNHLAVAKFLLDNGADVNIRRQSDGRTALNEAAELGYKDMVELLAEHGADVNETRPNYTDRMPPLDLAAKHGFKAVAEVLLAHHADVNVKNQEGKTPLHFSVENGYMAVVELLVTNGADINARTGAGQTPLHEAAAAGNTAVMEMLIAHQATVNARDNAGLTPLFLAVQADRLDAATLLLNNQADPNILDTAGTGQPAKGWAPLHVAVAGDQIEMVKLLLDHGARTDPRIPVYANQFTHDRGYGFQPIGGNGMRPYVGPGGFGGNASLFPGDEDVTPLTMAVMNGRKETVQLLIEHHADVNAKAGAGDSPLMMAAKMAYPNGGGQPARDRLGIAELLLDNGADVNLQNNDHESALSLAVNNNLPDLVKLILAHKPKVDILDKDSLTSLQHAVIASLTDIAALLLDSGANPDAKYPHPRPNLEPYHVNGMALDRGQGLLEVAVEAANKPLVQALLAHKADPNAQDDSGATPLSEAKRLESDPAHTQAMGEIVELLLGAGANDNLQRLSTISVSRGSANYKQTVFHDAADLPNHFSLLELMAAFYAPPYRGTRPIGNTGLPMQELPGLGFPDFGNIKISRLQKDGRTNIIHIDLETAFEAGDCSKDVPLQWGDIVEIPEADHNINDIWAGLSNQVMATLRKCLARQVAILVKGQTNLVALKPIIYHRGSGPLGGAFNIIYLTTGDATYDGGYGGGNFAFATPRGTPNAQSSFWLYDVVHDANVILTSSDLSRVKVTRIAAATRKPVSMAFDLQKQDPANELWLRDGDVIEIPEKP